MTRLALLLLLVIATTLTVSPSASAQNLAQANPADTAPLNLVIAQVQAALDEYQKNRGEGADALPPLASAEFNFKATSAINEGGIISFFIFKFGASRETSVTNDVTYTYAFPKPQTTPGLRAKNKKPTELKETLAQTIQSAAFAVKTAGTTTVGKLPFSKLKVIVQYGVKWDGNATVGAQFSFITVGLSGAVSSNTVQSVTLAFGQ